VHERPLPGINLELVELLGLGGFGEVWKAKNSLLPSVEPVALKFCLDKQAAKLLRHEAAVLDRVMRKGKHPGIVQLRHTYLSADPPCLEYEFVPGGDLGGLIQEWHQDKKGPSPANAANLMGRLAEIVGFAHLQNPPIVHRDLKPANILVQRAADRNLTFRVADFGIGGVGVGQIPELTRKGTVGAGIIATVARGSYTPLYASPQQMRGGNPDPRDDVYSLGVIWYQLLIGDLNVGAPSGMQWSRQLQQKGMPEGQVQLLAACVEPQPEFRPANAAVLAQRLQMSLKASDEAILTGGAPDGLGVNKARALTSPSLPTLPPVPQLHHQGRAPTSPTLPTLPAVPQLQQRMHRVRLVGLLRQLLESYQTMERANRKGCAIGLGIVLGLILGLIGAFLVALAFFYGNGPPSSPPGPSILFFLGTAAAIPLLIMRRKNEQHFRASQNVLDLIQQIGKEYPEEFRAWGGKAIMDNPVTVAELIRSLGK